MKKREFLGLAFFMAVMSFTLFNSCEINIGLGSAIDTEVPNLTIENPPTSSVIRDAFVISGTYSDDGEISGISVELKNSDSNKSYNFTGKLDNDTNWSVAIDPLDEKSKIPDGKYEVRITISDKGGHKSNTTRSFVIDNTPPVLVLSRPSSTKDETDENKIESYGQNLTLEGQIADANDIEKLIVDFYSADDPDTVLATKVITSIPPTISLDVAKFLDNDVYSKLFGNDIDNIAKTKKTFYCTVAAYDCAKHYPLESEEDELGNKQSEYILMTDWQNFQNSYEEETKSTIKLPDLYAIKAGTSAIKISRSATENLISSIFDAVESKGSFRLNPKNNPTFLISTLDLGATSDIESDQPITVQLFKGLDGISLKNPDKMAVYLQPVSTDEEGNEVIGEKIYPQKQKFKQTGDGQIDITILKDDCKDKSPVDENLAAANAVSLEYGMKYILGVDGEDIKGNDIMPSLDGREYRICFRAKKQAPSLKIESPAQTTSYVKKDSAIIISGTTSIPDGKPVISITCKIDDGDTKDICDPFIPELDKDDDNQLVYKFSKTLSKEFFDQENPHQYAFEITSDVDGWKTSVIKTIVYDVKGPTISIDSMRPTAEKYDPEKEDGIPESGSYLNGDVKMQISILDDDSVNTEIKEQGSDAGRPRFVITDDNDNPIKFRADDEEEKFSTHYIKTPTKQTFVIHTKDIPDGKIKIKIFAEDRAGNLGVDIDDQDNTSFVREYIVDQSTDAPVILPYNPASVTLKYSSTEDIDNAFATTENAKNIKSVLTTGSSIQLKLIDDDGIKSVTFKRGEKDTDENLDEKTGEAETQAGNPTELLYTYQLPLTIGKFKCSVTVEDVLGNVTTKTFWIVTTGAAPVVSVVSTKPDNKIITLASTNIEETAHKQITNSIEIDSGYDKFTVSRFEKINGTEIETVLYGNDNKLTAKTFDDIFVPSANRSENKIRYVVTDDMGHSGERDFIYYVDNTAPVINADTIVVPDASKTEEMSFKFKSGTASDTAPAGEKESGIAKIQFTFDSAEVAPAAQTSAHIKTITGVSALNETVLFGDDEYKYAFGPDVKEGERTIYVRAIDEVGNIGAWVPKPFIYDTSKPILSITSYKLQDATDFESFTDNTTEFDITNEFALGGKVSDDYGIKTFEIWQKKVGGTYENSNGIKLFETASPNKSWTIDKLPRDESNLANSNVDSGSYVYTIIATDKAEKSTTKTITANIDITKPVVDFDATTKAKQGMGAINSSPFMFSGTVVENTPKISGIYYKIIAKTNLESAAPAAPSSHISELLTASKWTAAGWKSITPEASWSFYRDISTGESEAIAEGKYFLYMYAVDGAGNLSELAKQEFHVDMAAPVITATAPEFVNSHTNASGSAADLRKVVINGTVVESNGLLSFTISRNGSNSSITPDENGNWTFTDIPETDGKYEYEIKATDLVGKTATIKKNVTVDTSKPVYTANSLKVGSKNWDSTSYYKDTTLKMSGTYTDETSGMDTLYYYIQYPGRSGTVPADLTAKENGNMVADGEVSLKANSTDATKYDFNFTVVDYKNNAETANTLYVQALDIAGNKSDVKQFTINIDTTAPELTALYYKVGEGTIKEAGGTVYVNGTLPITVYGNYKDAESGAEPLTGFKINGTAIDADVSYSTTEISSSADIPSDTSFASYSSANAKAIRSWKAVFTPATDGKFELEGRNGTYDEAVSLTGGKTSVNPFKITLDTTGPSISNVSITPSNNTVAYKKTESNGAVNYYVNNSTGTTFTFAGVSADSTGVDTVKLEIFNSDNTKTYSETKTKSEWSFAGVNLSALTGTQAAPSKAKITVTDIAGNATAQELRIVFDTTAPKAMHWADSNYKDVYFRIGSGTGSKYSYGSWGNASTIEIRGTFAETGSGLKVIHYAIFDAEPTGPQISSFEAGTLTKGGSVKVLSNFAPLSETVTQTVSHSGGSGSKEITTNFDTVLSGFNEEYNYLVLVAEDYVGNRAADTLAVYDGETTGTSKWNSENHNTATAYYRINKDTLAPVISSIEGEETTQTTDVPLTINITDKNPVEPTVEIKKAGQTTVLKTRTASTPTGSDSTYTSTVTIPFASGVLAEDGIYDIEVTVKDKAENTSATVTKRIVRDHIAPTIAITKPASESGDFIKSTNYKFEGTVTDETCGIKTTTATLYKVTGTGSSRLDTKIGDTESISLDANGKWAFQVYELEAADYIVKINATDIAGNAAVETESPVIKIDSVPPKVSVESSNLNDSTGNSVTALTNGITYYTKGSYSITVKVDDANFDYDYVKPDTASAKLYEVTGEDNNNASQELTITKISAKEFSISPKTPADGIFTYTIKVEDKAGNKADDVIIKVQRDTTGPSVEIRNPGVDITDPKNSLDADTYSFRINANDGSGVGVSFLYYLFSTSPTAPGTSEAAESAWDGGAFTDGDKIIEMNLEDNKDAQTSVKKTKLCEGTWYLHSWAKDKSGNKSSVSTRKFSIDKKAPKLEITQALNEGSRNVITVGSTGYALSGTVSDSNELASLVLKVDGESSTITPSSGTEEWRVIIEAGSDNGKLKSNKDVEIELIATDIAGKTTTKKFTLYNDTKNPELEITAPVLNEPVATLGKVIKGTASDDGYGIDKVEYKLYRGLVSSANEATATVVTSEDKDVTSENFPVEIKGEQWYIEDSTNGMPLGTPEGQLTLKVTATEKKNGTYGGGSTSKYVSFYFDKANPNLDETGVGTTGKTTNTTFALSGTASDSNALASVTINWKAGGADKSVTLTTDTNDTWSQEFVVGTANSSANNYVADGANEFTIIATDITGKTKQLTRTVTVDTQKPTVGDITVTTAGTAVGTATWYKTSNIEVTVAVSENGLSGISKVEYQAEDGTWTPLSYVDEKYQGTIRFTGDGAKTFNIKATDVAGNVSEEATASVNIDTSAPELSALYFKKGTGAAQSITSPVYLQSGTQITVYGNYKDEQSGVKALAFKLGSASVTPTVTYSTTEIGSSAPVDSNYSIASTAITGNETTIRSWKAVFIPSTSGAFVVTGDNRTTNPTNEIKIFDITIDDTAPTVQIKTPAADITDGKNALNGTSYTFSVNASDGIGVGVANLQYAFSKEPSSPAATEWETIDFAGGDKSIEMPLKKHTTETRESGKVTELCEGTWYLYVKATDKAGNVNTTPVKRTFKVDMAAPELTIPSTIQEGKRNVISSEVGTNGYVLSGTVSDTNALTSLVLKVDNVETTITPASGTAWTATIAKGNTDGKLKSDEAVEVELIATDIAGKTTSKNFILYYDTKDPELEITAPVADEPVETAEKVIKGTVSDDGYGIDKVEYKLYSGVVTAANESTATVVTSDDKDVTSENFPVEIKGEQWYIKASTGMPLGTAEGSLTLKVTATEKKNGTYGGRSTSKYVSFYFDKKNPDLDETGIGSAGKTTKDGFTLSGKVWDSNAIASLTIKCGNKTWVSGTDSNITINPTTSEPAANNWTATFVVGEETSTNTNTVNPNNIADGTNEFTIIAKDISGKEKQLTRTVIVDTVAPTCGTLSITSTGKTVGTGTNAKTWYKTSFIDIKLENVKDENGTGISKVEYTTETGDSAKWYPMSGSGTTYTATVNCTSQGLNSIRVKVTDAAGTTGNETAAGTKDVYIDTNAPTLGTSKVKYLTGDFAAVSELLINGKNSYQLQIEASDAADETAANNSGVASVTYFYGNDSNNIPVTTPDANGKWNITVPVGDDTVNPPVNGINKYDSTKTNAIYAIIKDNAGNEVKERILTVTKDTAAPTVEIKSFTTPGSKTKVGTVDVPDVNGIITISGSANDGNKLENVVLEYTDGSKDAEDNVIWNTISQTSESTVNNWIAELATTSLTDNTKYTIKAIATDAAGNTKEDTKDIFVNQNTDRPVISFSNIELGDSMSSSTANNHEGYVWLKNTTKVIGTVSDDDGVQSMQISLDGSNWKTVSLSGSAFSYDLKNFYTTKKNENNEDVALTEVEKEAEANGPKVIYFKVVDKGVPSNNSDTREFTSASASSISAVKISDGTNEYGSSAKPDSHLYIKVDTLYPQVILKGAKLASDDSFTNAYNTIRLGGEEKSFVVKFAASDAMGIQEVSGTADFVYTTGTGNQKVQRTLSKTGANKTTATENGETVYTLTFTLSDDDVTTLTGYAGAVNVRVVAKDTAGNETPQTASVAYDFAPSTVTSWNPSSETTLSGSVTAYGMLSENAKVWYAISPSATVGPNGSVTSWIDGDGNTTDFASAKTVQDWHELPGVSNTWTVNFDNGSSDATHVKSLNMYLIDYGIAPRKSGALATSDDIESSFNKFVKLYLWIKTQDDAGNIKDDSVHELKVDPQGDKPSIAFSYPATNGKTLGNEVSIYGTAQDLKGTNIGVDSVWVQIKSTTHGTDTTTDYGTAPSYDETVGELTMTLTTADLDYMASNGYHVYKMSEYVVGGENNTEWTVGGTTDKPEEWAALASSSGASWNISINKDAHKELNPPEGTNSNAVGLRVYARDGDGKISLKADRYVIFDADNPIIKDLYLVQSSDGKIESGSTASRQYTPDMFVKGKWYLTGTVTDNMGISELTINGETLIITQDGTTSIANGTTIKGSEDNPRDWTDCVKIESSTAGETVTFKYPLATDVPDSFDKISFRIVAKDKVTSGIPHEKEEPITVNYDNKPPEIATTEEAGKNISADVQQRNSWYTFSSKVTEASADNNKTQSGFAYTAFYFTRKDTVNSKDYIYDVLKARDDAAVDVTGITIPALGEEDDDSENTIVSGSNIYWYRKNITRQASLNTFTVSDTTGIRKNALVYIDGAMYLITSVTGTSVTIDGYPKHNSDNDVAYVAIAGIVDNTIPEGDGESIQSDGYYNPPSRDDGDRMIESVDKSGTTWTWQAQICSRNIADGPITLHYVVFDKAGNHTPDSVTGTVSNNRPRIAGAIFATDYNGDGDTADAGEQFANYSIAKSYTNYWTGGTESTPVFDPDKNVKNSNAKNPVPTSQTFGAEDEPIAVLRGKTVITPEIIGGNGKIFYSYKINNDNNKKGQNAKQIIDNGSLDYTAKTGDITIQLGDLLSWDDTADASTAWPFEFTFWDSTAGTEAFHASHPSQTAQLTMYFAIQAQTVGTPTVTINPFFWKGLKENSIEDSDTASSVADLKGHIELEDDWKKTSAYSSTATSGLYDGDPKVSGKIVITGTAHDDSRIQTLTANIFGTEKVVATFTDDAKELVSSFAKTNFETNNLWFNITEQTINAAGHTVKWELHIDTATMLSSVAGIDQTVSVTATNFGVPTVGSGSVVSIDGTAKWAETTTYAHAKPNTLSEKHWSEVKNIDKADESYYTDVDCTVTVKASLEADASSVTDETVVYIKDRIVAYKMDVVPYIKSISTPNRTVSGLKDNNIRSANGKYSILANRSVTSNNVTTSNDIVVTGFNLSTSSLVVRLVSDSVMSATGNDVLTYNKAEGTGIKNLSLSTTGRSTSRVTIKNGSGNNGSNVSSSGYLEVFSNQVRSLNNLNADNACGVVTGTSISDYENYYNREPDYYTTKNVRLTDDRYLRFFDMKDTGIKNGYYPVMLMNGNNPVFGYVDLNGINSLEPMSTFQNACYQPQRMEYDVSDNKISYIEYLIGGLSWDQMAMARDDSGRYIHGSVYNYAGDAIHLVYNQYAEQHTWRRQTGGNIFNPTYTTYTDGWGHTTKYQNYGGSQAESTGNNAITLESTSYGENGTLIGRYQGMKLKVRGNSTSNNGAIYYMAYFDDNTADKELIFRTFNIGSNNTNRNHQLNNGYTNLDEHAVAATNASAGNDNNVQGRITAATDATKYLDLGVTSDGYAVIVYYDKDGKLRLVHSNAAVTGAITGTTFSETNINVTSYIGQYVSMAIDSSNHIHIAAFDANKSTLRYIYLDNFNDTKPDEYTVDASTSVGKWTQIKIHNGKPYIAYYNNAEDGQKESIRLAYLSSATVADGYDNSGYATGAWEYMTVPSLSPAQGGDTKFQSVCLDFDSNGLPVVGYLGTNLEFGKWLTE